MAGEKFGARRFCQQAAAMRGGLEKLSPTNASSDASFQRRWLIGCCCLCLAGWGGTDAQADEGVSYLASHQLRVPFSLDRHGPPPEAVVLEASRDQGRSWNEVARSTADGRDFSVQLPADGLYWLRLRTRHGDRMAPPAPGLPLQVVIDTQRPVGQLELELDEQGWWGAEVAVADRYLEPSSVKLEYQTELKPEWQTLELDAEAEVADALAADSYRARARWQVSPRAKQLAVRLTARDRAGNQLELVRHPELPRVAHGDLGWQLASNPQPPPLLFGQDPGFDLPETRQPHVGERIDGEPIPTPPGRPVMSQQPGTEFDFGRSDLQLDGSRPPSAFEASPSVDPYGGLDPFHSRSRSFSLDYDVLSDSASGVVQVELWGTEDQGQTWRAWGTDPDRRSPFDVQVNHDGLFGFRMVVVTDRGLASRQPQPGEPADAWILVDTQPPQPRIVSALYGRGEEAGQLVIEYLCQDADLAERPVSFSFSDSPQGPWTTLATGLRNSGRYLWRADPNLPRQIYLRLEVVDRAGNVGRHQLDVPIEVEGLAPRGRIQGFRPLE